MLTTIQVVTQLAWKLVFFVWKEISSFFNLLWCLEMRQAKEDTRRGNICKIFYIPKIKKPPWKSKQAIINFNAVHRTATGTQVLKTQDVRENCLGKSANLTCTFGIYVGSCVFFLYCLTSVWFPNNWGSFHYEPWLLGCHSRTLLKQETKKTNKNL